MKYCVNLRLLFIVWANTSLNRCKTR